MRIPTRSLIRASMADIQTVCRRPVSGARTVVMDRKTTIMKTEKPERPVSLRPSLWPLSERTRGKHRPGGLIVQQNAGEDNRDDRSPQLVHHLDAADDSFRIDRHVRRRCALANFSSCFGREAHGLGEDGADQGSPDLDGRLCKGKSRRRWSVEVLQWQAFKRTYVVDLLPV